MLSESYISQTVEKLFSSVEFQKEPATLYDPLRYMVSIGGKRLRPTLCITVYSLFKDYLTDDILEPALALELYHTFTLIHDDVMDNSPMRRGNPTVWKKWDNNVAILSGDVMLIDSYKRIAKAPRQVADRALELFSKTAAEVCDGQQLDMDYENVPEISMEDYCRMIGLKTAVLIACSAKMGAVVAGQDEDTCNALYDYGYGLGMAFQVADDYLDVYADPKVFGKPVGGDIVNNKKSWMLVRALEKTMDKQKLLDAMALPVDTEEQRAFKIETVRGIYTELGVDQDARVEIRNYTDAAEKAVGDIHLGSVREEELKRFAEKLIGRAK